ncbi:hypothetical protein FGO68_gene9635 [Halteria grandinella]|uniref:Uncharacterized protein n=1 Tax=Halteria grandinella TaxID=5974 RepID=A0A8J8T3M2_HALGN|nr:hypothetical protein FGO68_gene9635 [Halteria grandinella]
MTSIVDPNFIVIVEGDKYIKKKFEKDQYKRRLFSLRFYDENLETQYQAYLKELFTCIQKICILHLSIVFIVFMSTSTYQLRHQESDQREGSLYMMYTLLALLVSSIVTYYLSSRYLSMCMHYGMIQTIIVVIGLTEGSLVNFDVTQQYETSSLTLQIIAGISLVSYDQVHTLITYIFLVMYMSLRYSYYFESDTVRLLRYISYFAAALLFFIIVQRKCLILHRNYFLLFYEQKEELARQGEQLKALQCEREQFEKIIQKQLGSSDLKKIIPVNAQNCPNDQIKQYSKVGVLQEDNYFPNSVNSLSKEGEQVKDCQRIFENLRETLKNQKQMLNQLVPLLNDIKYTSLHLENNSELSFKMSSAFKWLKLIQVNNEGMRGELGEGKLKNAIQNQLTLGPLINSTQKLLSHFAGYQGLNLKFSKLPPNLEHIQILANKLTLRHALMKLLAQFVKGDVTLEFLVERENVFMRQEGKVIINIIGDVLKGKSQELSKIGGWTIENTENGFRMMKEIEIEVNSPTHFKKNLMEIQRTQSFQCEDTIITFGQEQVNCEEDGKGCSSMLPKDQCETSEIDNMKITIDICPHLNHL